MKIINNSEKVMKRFVDLPNGTVFIDTDGDVCIKTDAKDQEYDTVRLSDGITFHCPYESPCTVVKATLTIE